MKTYILLVADRRTGRVLDCQRATDEYSWSFDTACKELLDRHDLNVVDIIIRHPTDTTPIVAVEPAEEEFAEPVSDNKEPLTGLSADDDIPF